MQCVRAVAGSITGSNMEIPRPIGEFRAGCCMYCVGDLDDIIRDGIHSHIPDNRDTRNTGTAAVAGIR